MCKRIFVKVMALFAAGLVFAQTKPLYNLNEDSNSTSVTVKTTEDAFIVGTDNGVFKVSKSGERIPLLKDVKVTQIVKTDYRWFFVTANGILTSEDLVVFKESNNGLPYHTIKEYDGNEKTFIRKVPLLKDLCVDPLDQKILVTATKNEVYMTRDGGDNWYSIGSMSKNTAGMKSVAVAHMPTYAQDGTLNGSELVVFMSHPIFGFSYYKADTAKKWVDVSAGFDILPTFSYPDEISDIIPVLVKDANGNIYTELYCCQSYMPNIYRFNWKLKRAEKVYKGEKLADTIDSMCQVGNEIVFVQPGKINSINILDGNVSELPAKCDSWKKIFEKFNLNAAYIPQNNSGLTNGLQLNELWLLKPDTLISKYPSQINNKKAIYLHADWVMEQKGIEKYRKIITDNKLNALVIDMKDDYGLLRYDTNDELLKKKGFVSRYKIDIDKFVPEMKKEGIYLIARIVTFKDKHLATYDKSQYAIWDAKTNWRWTGIYNYEDILDEEGNPTGQKKTNYYDETWVDPYCEEVWEYNVAIAKELIERGFDEIQFDYIRFPTDGLNLGNVKYRWRDQGMDKESAITSFLNYVRKNVDAPIGVDIYGANGWFRSSVRTGQDVELMSDYVDVIGPMFYPSHFGQNDMNMEPWAERAYRIYFYGTYHNTIAGRNRVVVRPWIQAFYLNVKYDRQYYNTDYVKQEVFGCRDSVDRGYMYWNNAGRYSDICPDPDWSEPYPWKTPESKQNTEKPAFGSGRNYIQPVSAADIRSNNEMISVLDIGKTGESRKATKGTSLIMQVANLWNKVND